MAAMSDHETRAALERHWAASDADDFETEHQIYRADAVLTYPQSGERIRGRHNIQASRAAQPNSKRFAVRRLLGGGDLWISELVLTDDGRQIPRAEDRQRASQGDVAKVEHSQRRVQQCVRVRK
jgi:hypothetical protein